MKKFVYLFVILASICSNKATAQKKEEKDAYKYMHMLSPDELNQKLNTRSFVETAPPLAPAKSIAEFEPQAAVLVRYPLGIPTTLVAKLAEKDTVITIISSAGLESTVRNLYTSAGVNMSHCKFYIAYTDSYWTRDYGPMFTMDGDYNIGAIDFIYNRPRPNDDEIARIIPSFLGMQEYGMRVVHTGGNYMSDGCEIASSTTIVHTESQQQNGITAAQVDQRMEDYLGIKKHLVLQDPNNTYIDHIDCWGKFLAVDKVLIRSVPASHPRYAALEQMAQYWANETTSWGNTYKVFRVNTPNDEPYTNSLILNKRVFVPQMSGANDAAALQVYSDAMPGYEVIGVIGTYTAPWLSTDALHCRTHEIADKGYLYISHTPNFEPRQYSETYTVNAKIVALSKKGFYSDSLRLYYRFDEGEWNYSHLEQSQEEDHIFTGIIYVSGEVSKIDYYFQAADSSGRSQSYPMTGKYDPFTFEVIEPVAPVLTLSTNEIVFDNDEEIILTVSNNTQTTAIVDSVNNLSMMYSTATPVSPIEFPAQILPEGNISLKVSPLISIASKKVEYNIDTLKILTADSIYCVVIRCNTNLLTEINDTENKIINVYPNPFKQEVVINTALTHVISCKIHNLLGQDICVLNQNGGGIYKWNSENMPSGIYIISVETNEGVFIHKIIKQ